MLAPEIRGQVTIAMKNAEIALHEAQAIDMRRVPKQWRNKVVETRARLAQSVQELHALQNA